MPLTTPTLTTERLVLRPLTAQDADAVYAVQSDAEALVYWDEPAWTDPSRFERFLARSRQMADDDEGVRLVVERRDDGAVLGWCAVNGWNRDHRSAGICYSLARHAWGHGYGGEAARALVDWAFEALDLNRIQTETDTRNEASARILLRLGFQREGTLREDCVVDGVVSDSWVFGLLRREWRP